MEKFIALLVLTLLFSFTAKAQEAPPVKPPENQYSIEVLKQDSIFLNEKVFEVSKDSPRPDAKINSKFFTSMEQVYTLVKNLRQQAENISLIADKIDKEISKSKAVKQ